MIESYRSLDEVADYNSLDMLYRWLFYNTDTYDDYLYKAQLVFRTNNWLKIHGYPMRRKYGDIYRLLKEVGL